MPRLRAPGAEVSAIIQTDFSFLMRLAFMGTPALSIPSLELLAHDHEIVLVVTQPDKLAGRGHKLQAPAIKEYALERGWPIDQPERARDENFIARLRAAKPDAIAVVAYGQILPREILELPRENFSNGGCVNLHFSLLPRWRGAAPVQYSVWNGDTMTGVSTQWMAEKLDAGDIILQREVKIGNEETSGELFEKLTPLGARVLAETMRLMENGNAPRMPQDESQVTFAPTIKKEATRIDWSQSAREVTNQIRALNPKPGAWCEFHGEALKVWRARVIESPSDESTPVAAPGEIVGVREKVLAATGQSLLDLLEVQPAGKPKMSALDWARGARLQNGEKLE
jgi:methionyl-tRNA formyltransferase